MDDYTRNAHGNIQHRPIRAAAGEVPGVVHVAVKGEVDAGVIVAPVDDTFHSVFFPSGNTIVTSNKIKRGQNSPIMKHPRNDSFRVIAPVTNKQWSTMAAAIPVPTIPIAYSRTKAIVLIESVL
ncbi:hypothetical protein IAJ44_004227 [Salmonella enterica]|nr:hypothetical protein [Salmonella enterica]